MVVGGLDGSLIVALNDSALLYRSAATGGGLVARPLPTLFARPIIFDYVRNDDGDFEYVLGPTSHDKTVSLAVSPEDPTVVAVTGWTSVVDTAGPEQVWVSYDAGENWIDETYDLRAATGAIGQIRPSALLFVPVSDGVALLVGASNGVYVQKKKSWTRLGACAELPQVLVAGLSYEADVLVAATMGRGVYVMHNVSSVLDKVLS